MGGCWYIGSKKIPMAGGLWISRTNLKLCSGKSIKCQSQRILPNRPSRGFESLRAGDDGENVLDEYRRQCLLPFANERWTSTLTRGVGPRRHQAEGVGRKQLPVNLIGSIQR